MATTVAARVRRRLEALLGGPVVESRRRRA